MSFSIEEIIFWLILVDALGANLAAWTVSEGHWHGKFGLFGRLFPLARGWTAYYLVLVLWVGYALLRLDVVG